MVNIQGRGRWPLAERSGERISVFRFWIGTALPLHCGAGGFRARGIPQTRADQTKPNDTEVGENKKLRKQKASLWRRVSEHRSKVEQENGEPNPDTRRFGIGKRR
jgi:hypothetical protein